MKPNLSAALAASLALVSCVHSNREKPLPNIVFILADDLGYGDLSCYGQQKFSTPNIDRLAQQGMLFRQHYAGCTVSAPSRSCRFCCNDQRAGRLCRRDHSKAYRTRD